jgi:hypothetical protein
LQLIRLPAQLPGALDLQALNRQLQRGESQLDWSNLQQPTDEVQPLLPTLLAKLNLTDHLDLLGGDTMSEDLMLLINAYFKEDPEPVAPSNQAGQSDGDAASSAPDNDDDEPALWEPPAEEPSQPVGPLLKAPTESAIRDELQELILRDLLGPAGGEEEIIEDEARVSERYLVGLLAPNNLQTQPEEQDELGISDPGQDEEGRAESTNLQKPGMVPSSIGLSFCVDRGTTKLLVTSRWGHYQRQNSETRFNKNGSPKPCWKRIPRGGEAHPLELKEGMTSWIPDPEQEQVFVKGIIRSTPDSWLVTLFLVNGQDEPKTLRDQAWLFQPRLLIEAPEGVPVFQKRPTLRHGRFDEHDEISEQTMSAMLYRRYVSFAIGHGISVHAETLPDDRTCAIRLFTSVAPNYEIPRTEAPNPSEVPGLTELVLDMQILAESPASELAPKLLPLVRSYATWIEEQRLRIDDPAADLENYRVQANEALRKANQTLERIRQGIELLGANSQAAQAFAFMNRAMWQQRIHTLHAEARRKDNQAELNTLDKPGNRSWRPFQLAFILLNLPALTDLHHKDRSSDSSATADLLWFPTGGGKTEAYLGLTAYTLAIRRLQGTIEGRSGEEGIAVLMRYTLRLLTLQQFQRAAALICACEEIRLADRSGTWGTIPFRLGLWVGMRSTPNNARDSAESVRQAHGLGDRNYGVSSNPNPFTHCPWCGHPIDAGLGHVIVDKPGTERTFIYCGDPKGHCAFSKKQSPQGLPVVTVDSDIYRLLPSLLIATVDKFAQLPWNGATQMLFGKVDQKCSRHGFRGGDLDDRDSHQALGKLPRASTSYHPPLRPPDLIIQDELHLISGPLGTLVGLYETLVDHLATWEIAGKSVRPKVIAATATIRRADQQISSLFLRGASIFPPQGLDVEDNFFARQRKPTPETPGRRYLGICANGRRLKAVQIRVYVAHLAAAQTLYKKYGSAVDPWMTLVGYFNSMSDLAGTRRLVDDDIATRLWHIDKRGLEKRSRPMVEELTSRKNSSDIPNILSRLEVPFGGEGAPKTDARSRPLDVLLATNMISVGVDVKRLGLMVVTGQPKTSAEYIQATSRVGRNFPGLVCVIFNWARPRDLSHYEQFEHYHATFYQQVEALSVTPFAARALDRGLAGLLVGYVRLNGTSYSPNQQAGAVIEDDPLFEQALATLVNRANEVTGTSEAGETITAELLRLRKSWKRKADRVSKLVYKQEKGVSQGLLSAPAQGDWEDFTCLNSLREVEPTVNLVLNNYGMHDRLSESAEDESFEEER